MAGLISNGTYALGIRIDNETVLWEDATKPGSDTANGWTLNLSEPVSSFRFVDVYHCRWPLSRTGAGGSYSVDRLDVHRLTATNGVSTHLGSFTTQDGSDVSKINAGSWWETMMILNGWKGTTLTVVSCQKMMTASSMAYNASFDNPYKIVGIDRTANG